MLERDDHFPDEATLNRELDAIAAAVARGRDAERGSPRRRRHRRRQFPRGPFMVDEDGDNARRASLAASQASLVAALGGHADVPPGFDPVRVELAARTLLAKRRKGVAAAWPRLAESLGERFAERFSAFAAATTPHPNGPAADGVAFAEWLDGQRLLPATIVPELLTSHLRRGPSIGIRFRRTTDGSLLIGLRLPLCGVRVLSIPLPRRRPPRGKFRP